MNGIIQLYKLLSLGFAYPEETNWEEMEKILLISRQVLQGSLLEKVRDFENVFESVRGRIDEVRAEYLDIFDVGRAISPYETEYIGDRAKALRKTFELSDIAGFYQAFGLGRNDTMKYKESLDHISIELEFMAFLETKRLYAEEKNEMEHVEIVQDAQGKFFKDHLAKWGFLFCEKIREQVEGGLYASLGMNLEGLLSLERKRYG